MSRRHSRHRGARPRRPIAWDRPAGDRTTPPPSPTPPDPPQASPTSPAVPDDDPTATSARNALREPTPVELILQAAAAIDTTRPGAHRAVDGGEALTRWMLDSGRPELGALVLAIAAIHPDELLGARLRHAVPERVVHRGPPWLRWIDRMVITDVTVEGHVLPDGENILLSWSWPDRSPGTAVVYVDHNMGTIVKDAYVVAAAAEGIGALLDEHRPDPYVTHRPLDPADARARLHEALVNGDRLVDPICNETWPACRPLVEWLIRQLPHGGTGYARSEWLSKDRRDLRDDFAATGSVRTPGLDTRDVSRLATPIVEFACGHGLGDPLRLSPVSVEIALVDWLPRRAGALPASRARLLPDVLEGFVRFGHRRAGIPESLTLETIESVDRWRPTFLRAIERQTTPSSPETRPTLGTGQSLDEALDPSARAGFTALYDATEAHLIEQAGGREAYERLDDRSLDPSRPDASALTDGLSEFVTQLEARIEGWARQYLDDEVGVIARVVLDHVRRTDPAVLTRATARPDILAAAALWVAVTKVQPQAHLRADYGWHITTQADLAHVAGTSVSSLAKRAKDVQAAIDASEFPWHRYLHSRQRRHILRAKQHIADWRREHLR